MFPKVALLVFANASTSSPPWKPAVIATVALESGVLSPLVMLIPLSTVTGVEGVLSPARKLALPESAVMIGVWSVSATVTVRVALFGVTAVSVYVTARSAACH